MGKTKKKGLKEKWSGILSHPFIISIIIMTIYFMIDGSLLSVSEEADKETVIVSGCITLILLFLAYVSEYVFGNRREELKDLPEFVKHPKGYVIGGYVLIILLTIFLLMTYDTLMLKWFPNLGVEYYPCQIVISLLIAPVCEELVFRYYLYDKWAKQTFIPKTNKRRGTVFSVLSTGLIFVMLHPATTPRNMVLYWVPALLFYMMYETFGLYGAIFAHIIFNLFAL